MELMPRKMSEGIGVKQSTLIMASSSGNNPSRAPAKNMREEAKIIYKRKIDKNALASAQKHPDPVEAANAGQGHEQRHQAGQRAQHSAGESDGHRIRVQDLVGGQGREVGQVDENVLESGNGFIIIGE